MGLCIRNVQMLDNTISVGNCVLKLQQEYSLFNPFNSLRNSSLEGISIIKRLNSELSNRLYSLYNVLLSKNREQIHIHSKQLYSFITAQYKTALSDLDQTDKDVKVAKDFYDSWGIFWILDKLQSAEPMEDFYYAEQYGLEFTDEDRQEQLELREDIFNICLEDLIDDLSEEIIETYGNLVEILKLYSKDEEF